LVESITIVLSFAFIERMMIMAPVAQETQNNQTTRVDEAMNILFGKLEEAIDDMEKGRVQTINEAWEEIDTI
jgi:hypothetical protein